MAQDPRDPRVGTDRDFVVVGDILYGYCGGFFDESYGDKRVEAVGRDWVVAREEGSDERPMFASSREGWEIHETLAEYLTKPEDERP